MLNHADNIEERFKTMTIKEHAEYISGVLSQPYNESLLYVLTTVLDKTWESIIKKWAGTNTSEIKAKIYDRVFSNLEEDEHEVLKSTISHLHTRILTLIITELETPFSTTH